MFSFPQVELASLSAAALFETALLLALVERRNWSRAPLPVVLLLTGVWMWHAGSLGERVADSAWGVGSGAAVVLRLVMATGLMMIPSAMLHAWARLRRSGLECGRPPEARYATLYLPMLMLLPIGVDILSNPESRLTVVLMAWLPSYSMWAGIVNLGMAASMWKLRRSLRPEAERFLKWTAGVLVATVIVQWIVVLTIRDWPDAAPWMILVVSLTPVLARMAGGLYLWGAIVLGILFTAAAGAAAVRRTAGAARLLFLTSVLYLPALFGLLVVDRR